MKIIIPSKNRVETLRDNALKLLPDATVCVGESEAEAYREVTDNILTHPDDVVGIGPLRQWIIDHVDDELLVMADDDVHGVITRGGIRNKVDRDPQRAMAIIERVGIAARDAGAHVFGFSQGGGPLQFQPFNPFTLSTWVGGLVGVVGKAPIRYDEDLLLRADIDYCLKSLRRHRFVWVDNRYNILHRRFGGRGGNAGNRSRRRHEEEIARLLERWRPFIEHKQAKGTTRLVIRVPRR